MEVIRVTKGYDIPISGAAEESIVQATTASRVAIKPPDIRGFVPRLKVKVGDRVALGDPLAEHKADTRILLTSPAGGQVVAINRGPRRRIEDIVIEVTLDSEPVREFPKNSTAEIAGGIGRETILARLLESGLWPAVVQRPFAKLADPDVSPQGIFVTAIETEPLAANPLFQIGGMEEEFQAGLHILRRLTEGTVWLCVPGNPQPALSVLTDSDSVRVRAFQGPHPAGTVGTHIFHLDPLKKRAVHWTIKAVDVARIGGLFLEGRVPVERIVAVAGEGVTIRKYFRSRVGAPIETFLHGGVAAGNQRFISGGPLTGKKVDPKSYLGYHDTTLSVIPEGGKRTFLGWLLPGFDKSSFVRVFASRLVSGKRFEFDTSLNGEPRAIVPIGSYEAVMALDIQPTFLVKSILYGDLEEAEKLGLLECAEEDVALCSYVCHSKIDFCGILRRGLDQYEKEG